MRTCYVTEVSNTANATIPESCFWQARQPAQLSGAAAASAAEQPALLLQHEPAAAPLPTSPAAGQPVHQYSVQLR